MSDEEIGAMLSRLEPKLHRIAKGYLHEHADQQDAVQECLYKAWLNRSRINHPEYFGTWVTRIMINVCLDILKRSAAITPVCSSNDTICKDNMERLIEYDALYAALNKTSEEDRRLIRLRYFEGYMLKEISTITHLPVTTVQSRLMRIDIGSANRYNDCEGSEHDDNPSNHGEQANDHVQTGAAEWPAQDNGH